jgi:copper chaperone
MEKYQFKTNINCSGCVAKVTPLLNENPGVNDWKVDTGNPDKILTVQTANMEKEDIKAIIERAGFKADSLV